MCGRYASAKDPDALVEEFEVEESLVDKPLHARLQRRADQTGVRRAVPTTRGRAGRTPPAERQLRVVRWGLVPSWAKDPSIGSRMINARSETVAEKPAFRRAFGKRRCLLPADGYYEWYTPTGDNVPLTSRGKPVKQPFYIHRADGHSLAMAGLYEWWHDKTRERDDPEAWLLTATIITTSATDAVGRIHDRMPVVIAEADWERWLDPAVGGPRGGRAADGTGSELHRWRRIRSRSGSTACATTGPSCSSRCRWRKRLPERWAPTVSGHRPAMTVGHDRSLRRRDQARPGRWHIDEPAGRVLADVRSGSWGRWGCGGT